MAAYSLFNSQIDSVAAQALADSGRQYTTAFNTIDITSILGLASAAPMYTCYLSSLWAEALRNPQQYAKRDVPTQDEKTKLIVLFERRNDNNSSYDLAELLAPRFIYATQDSEGQRISERTSEHDHMKRAP